MKNSSKVNFGPDGFSRTPEHEAQIDQTVASVFGSPSGAEVLKYLRSITIETVNGPAVTTEELRHMEGQRYLVALIERRIDRANRSKQ